MHDDLMSLADGVQAVVLRRPGSDFETKIPKALIRLFRSRRHFRVSESILPTRSAHWYFSHDSLDAPPQDGDEIEDAAGDRWTILEVNALRLNGIWQCVARRYAARFGLDEYVDHLRGAFTKTSGGTLQQGFRVLKSGIAAKCSAPEQTFDGAKKQTIQALLREPIDAGRYDALRRADGTIYEIEQVRIPRYESGWTEVLIARTE